MVSEGGIKSNIRKHGKRWMHFQRNTAGNGALAGTGVHKGGCEVALLEGVRGDVGACSLPDWKRPQTLLMLM